MRYLRSLLCLVLLFAVTVARAQTPGTPPANIKNSFALSVYQTKLKTIVTQGDVVLLKSGTSKLKSNWAAVVRFVNQPYLESSVGYAYLYQDETSGFSTLTASANAVYIKAATSTTYKAGGTTYTIKVTLP